MGRGHTGGVDPFARLLAAPPALPVVSGLARIGEVLAPGRALVLSAPPGSGKTTLVPALLAREFEGRILVAEPRRIAARAAARRLSHLLGHDLGGLVGFAVKGEARRSAATRVEFVTPGVLVRLLRSDPSLEGVSAVLLDEFHERHLDTDLVLGMLLDARSVLREDLHLCIASATLDVERIRALLGTRAPTDAVEVPGAVFPLELRYAPPPRGVEPLETDRWGAVRVPDSFLAHIASCAEQCLRGSRGDLLVFVPGVREVNGVVARLRAASPKRGAPDFEVLALHGALPPALQDEVLSPPATGPRRIIVSTPIAESSLTVPRVTCVIDSGLAREPRLDLARGASSLVTVRAARSRCEQRAGRAARLGPGLAIRCFDEVDWAKRPAHALPEMLVANLGDAELQALRWSPKGLAGLPLLDAPPPAALEAARTALHALGLLEGDRVTPLGETAGSLPIDPALGAALLHTAPRIGLDRAASFGALLAEGPRVRDADLATFARRLARLDPGLAKTVRRSAARLSRQIAPHVTPSAAGVRAPTSDEDALAAVVAHARPSWIARSRKGGRTYLLADGQAAALPEGSPLEGVEWLAIAELTRSASADGFIRAAVPLTPDEALVIGGPLVIEARTCALESGRVRAVLARSLGAIPLGEARPVEASAQEALEAILNALRDSGPRIMTWSDSARSLRSRIGALHGVDPGLWPDVGDEALIASAPVWLAAESDSLAGGAPLASVDMAAALRSLLDWSALRRLDALAPSDIEIPTGAKRRIDWSSGRPVLALRVQEAFGWLATPAFADGRLPLVLHLTDPAGRPAAVTSDLASFWAGAYQQVRAQLRGRYPKHPWPEDPFTERPTSRAKPRPRPGPASDLRPPLTARRDGSGR